MFARRLAILACIFLLAPTSAPGQTDAIVDNADDAQSIEKVTQRGPVTATVRLEPASPTIGDTLTLTLEVAAEKDVELLMPEFGQALERFPIVDFFPDERVDDEGRTVSSQRYTLELAASGKSAIPPLIIEFVDHRADGKPAPDGEDAYELLTDRLPFEVLSVVPKEAAGDLRPPMAQLAPLRSPRAYGIAALVALIAAAAVVFFIRRSTGGWNKDARRRSAYEIALERIQALTARPLADADDIGDFFVELSDLIRHYLEDRFELRAPELTTEEFLTVASGSPDLSVEHKRFLGQFLESADMVKFARFVPGKDEVNEALDLARQFLDQTRDDATPPAGVEHDA